jgi:mono/diheme cytochrome c family protein
MLRGIAAKHDMPWLYKWIHSSALIKSGDAAAVKVYEENNKVAMTAFALSDADIDNIIAYTQSQKKAEALLPLLVLLLLVVLMRHSVSNII